MRTGGSGLVAVLFTDLAGSTELMSRLGERSFDDVRRAHFASLGGAIAAHRGEEVKNTGDGIMAVFSAAADAVDAAMAMQQAVARHAAKVGVPLAIRVGVSLGDATFEDGDVFGAPVVEAARLLSVAEAGEILATSLVQAIAAGRTEARFTDRGTFELKGLPAPVAVCEVAWEPLAGGGLPLPVLMTGTGRIFVGRDGELERLQALWKEAAAGERRLVLVGGEPGVGKTRLAAELATAVHPGGAAVLAGRCDEDLGMPYQPFVEALRHYLRGASGPGLRLGRHAGELVRLVPEVAEALPDLAAPLRGDPETERYRLFEALTAWLSALSREMPVLLVLDDLHWAAKPTLLLLRHVLRSPDPLRLLVVATYRDSEVGRSHPLSELLSDLRRQEGVARIGLSGLDVAAVESYLEQIAGRELGEDGEGFSRAVWAETEGNPFFVGEVLRHLAETGTVVRRGGHWVMAGAVEDLGIPEGIRDVVGRRLSRLSEATNRVLAVAAVAGVEFEPAVVSAAAGLDEDALLAALEEAASARILVEVAGAGVRYAFAHGLVRATLYDELSAARRVALHRKVAEAIEAVHANRLDEQASALARHWARASAPAAEVAKAVSWAKRAGDRALALLAHDEAVDWYRQAVELLDAAGTPTGDHRRVALLVDLGDAQRRAGDPGHRQTLLAAAARAKASGDADTLARAALANHRGFFSASGAVDADAVGILEAALEAVGPADLAVRARLLANLAEELGFSSEHERRQACVAEALAIARRLGDPVTLGHVLARRYSTLPTTAKLREEMVELAALATRLDDATLLLWAGLWGALSDWTIGDATAFEHGLAASAQRAGELGQPLLRWVVAFIRSAAHRVAGRLADAERMAGEALAVAQTAGIPDALGVFGVNLFWIRYDQGRLEEVVDRLEAGGRRERPNPLTLALLALTYCELERHEEARRVLDRLAVGDFAVLPGNFAWPYVLAVLAEVCAGVGDVDRAGLLYDWLMPHQGLVVVIGGAALGSVDHHLGLLAAIRGRFDEAEAHFSSAAALHERMAGPSWLARTHLEWARMLLARRRPGDAQRAAELLASAIAAATELGFAGVEGRARRLLVSRDHPSRRPGPGHLELPKF